MTSFHPSNFRKFVKFKAPTRTNAGALLLPCKREDLAVLIQQQIWQLLLFALQVEKKHRDQFCQLNNLAMDITPRKFNSKRPLKIGRAPKGKYEICLPVPSFFGGELLKIGGVCDIKNIEIIWTEHIHQMI